MASLFSPSVLQNDELPRQFATVDFVFVSDKDGKRTPATRKVLNLDGSTKLDRDGNEVYEFVKTSRIFAVEDERWQEELDAQRARSAVRTRSAATFSSYREQAMVNTELQRQLSIKQLIAQAAAYEHEGDFARAHETRMQAAAL